MAKKLSLDINLFEGTKMLGLVTHLKDYRVAYSINNALNVKLKKYADLKSNGKKGSFSWYYFTEGGNYHNISLISNTHEEGKLVPELKVDYLFLIKNVFDEDLLTDFVTKIRKNQDISWVYEIEIPKIKKVDFLLEEIEMHELTQIKKSRPKPKKRITQ